MTPRRNRSKSGGRTNRIFISYSSGDKTFAELAAAELREAKLDPWIDSARILVGDDILEKLGEGLKTMDLLLFVVSRGALKSPWVDRELKFASMRTIRDKEIRILPFVIDDTPVDDLPWGITLLNVRRVTADLAVRKDVCGEVREVLKRRLRPPSRHPSRRRKFKGDVRIDRLIRPVKLADWNAAELAALEIVKLTDASGRNELFETLLDYQDCDDEDPRFWGDAAHDRVLCQHGTVVD